MDKPARAWECCDFTNADKQLLCQAAIDDLGETLYLILKRKSLPILSEQECKLNPAYEVHWAGCSEQGCNRLVWRLKPQHMPFDVWQYNSVLLNTSLH